METKKENDKKEINSIQDKKEDNRQLTLFLRKLLQRNHGQADRLQEFKNTVDVAYKLIKEKQEVFKELGYSVDELEEEYRNVCELQQVASSAYDKRSSGWRKQIDTFAVACKPLFEKYYQVCDELRPKQSSYHNMLGHAWNESERSNEELTSHTEIAEGSQENSDRIMMENSHAEADLYPIKLIDQDWEEVKKLYEELKKNKLEIENITKEVIRNKKEKDAIVTIKEEIDQLPTIEREKHKVIKNIKAHYHEKEHKWQLSKYIEDFTPKIFEDHSAKQEDDACRDTSNNLDNTQEMIPGNKDVKSNDKSNLPLKYVRGTYLKRLQEYAAFRLQANENYATRLQQDLEGAKEKGEDLVKHLAEAVNKHHKLAKELEALPLIDSIDGQITTLQTQVNDLKKQTFHAIKEHEAILEKLQMLSQYKEDTKKQIKDTKKQLEVLKQSYSLFYTKKRAINSKIDEKIQNLKNLNSEQWKLYEEEKKMTDTVYQCMKNLTTAEKQLDQLKKQRSTSLESQPSTSLKEIHLYDLYIYQYRNKLVVDHLNLKLRENEKHLEFLSRERKQIADSPKIKKHHDLRDQGWKTYDWRNEFLRHRNKLLDIIYQSPELDKDASQFKEAFDLLGTNLLAKDLQKIDERFVNLDKIHQGLQREEALFKKILDDTKHLKESVSVQDEEYRENIDKLINDANNTIKTIENSIKSNNELKEKAKQDLGTLDKSLAKAQEQLEDICKQLSKDNPYFSWYIRTAFTTDKYPYSSTLDGSCVLAVTKMLMDYLGKDAKKISDFQIAGPLKLCQEGASPLIIPKVLRLLNVDVDYSPIILATTTELENILERGKQPVAVGLWKTGVGGHAVLVESIRKEGSLKFVRIYDLIPQPDRSSPDKILRRGGESRFYEIPMEEFQKDWSHDCAVPTKALNPVQYIGAKLLEGLIYPYYLMDPKIY